MYWKRHAIFIQMRWDKLEQSKIYRTIFKYYLWDYYLLVEIIVITRMPKKARENWKRPIGEHLKSVILFQKSEEDNFLESF
ncbi:hypothetical protein D7V87_16830 [Clostridium sp. 1xD42-85]|nr:hypothetical protein D7V87_16830 [Clostridium sp. 1xD42-85]